ncbi:integrase catalytic domain-containing protein [Trichonephila clavipes]|uniref:Integrase catalytic domain-containing protein n=1 Tax=Trichonephila clavipes TaxID=2585209 RepID=A0A8X6VVB9_TRICX|nr:integrase catalytic domain-containing protein [Trichonephila clavipes]
MTSEASWHHVKSQENPADCASRGIAASKLKVHKLWWSGPQWLSQDSLHFPSINLSTSCEKDEKCEEKSSTVLTNVSTSSQGSYLLEIIAKYSSISRLIRVIAWCNRSIKNCRSFRVTGVLTSKEIDDATKIVFQIVQELQFHSEIQLLKKKHPIPNSSKLLPLGIFLDTDGIIKVGGRLKNSRLSPIQKLQILLPKSHHLTNLVIQYFHHIKLNSGPATSYARTFLDWCSNGFFSRRGPFTTSVLKGAMEFNSTSPKSVLEEIAPGVPKSIATKNQVE